MQKKGQISLELLVVALFLIVFIYVYNNLAAETVNSLELSKIKEQEQDIALSLNEFLQYQRGISLYPSGEILEYGSTFKIPEINLASKKLPCKIDLTNNGLFVFADFEKEVSYNLKITYESGKFDLPENFYCGQEIECKYEDSKIKCR